MPFLGVVFVTGIMRKKERTEKMKRSKVGCYEVSARWVFCWTSVDVCFCISCNCSASPSAVKRLAVEELNKRLSAVGLKDCRIDILDIIELVKLH